MIDRGTGWLQAPSEGWLETAATLQMWSQIVGKVRLARAPPENHWWHVPLYLTARGLTTSPIPDGTRAFQIDFDFIDHAVVIAASDGGRAMIPLAPMPVADFYAELLARLKGLGVDIRIWPVPVEVADATSFPAQTRVSEYRPEIAQRLWEIL